MRKLFITALIIVASFGMAMAQDSSSSSPTTEEIPNMGKAPAQPNGIGRLDLRVLDDAGNPVQGAFAKLESRRTDGFFCESWNSTNTRGVAVLPPIHMGNLTLIIKAKGFQTQKIEVPASSLNEPVRITMVRKK
jgi:hypothetical protein